MRQSVKTDLPESSAPVAWAAKGDNVLYTAHIPIRRDGSIETGDIGAQARLTFDNLKHAVEAAGGTLDDVTQVIVYLTAPEHFAGMNAVYQTYFKKPYPNRATLIAGLMVPGAHIEIVAYAHIGKPAG